MVYRVPPGDIFANNYDRADLAVRSAMIWYYLVIKKFQKKMTKIFRVLLGGNFFALRLSPIFTRIQIPYARHFNLRFVYFFPFLYWRAVYITDLLWTKNENSSFFKPKLRGLYTRAVTDQEQVIVLRVQKSEEKRNFWWFFFQFW